MSANWWEIGKPVQDIDIISAKDSIAESDTEDKSKQNWWEIGRPVEEPAKTEAASFQPVPTTTGQGAGMSFQDLFGGPITPQTAEVYKTATRLPGNTLILGGKEVVNAVKDPKTYQNLGEQILEGIKQTGEGLSLSQIDSIPDSTMIPMPSIGVETPSDAMAYWKSFGINSDAELKAFKQSKQAELIENIQSSKKKVQELTPEGLSLTQRGLRGGIESVAIMAPGAVASAATRSPIPVLTATGTLEGFSGYGEARTEGKSPASALAYGGINSAIEVLTEVAPTGKLLSAFGVKDKSELKDRLFSFAVAEMGTEQAATALQTLNAVAFGLDEELANANSVGEIARIQAERQALTAISTIVAGGTQAGAIGLVNRAQEQLIRRNIEAETRDIEGIGSAMEIERIMKIRSKALDDAQAIAPPSIEQIGLLQGQQPNDIQYGTTYAQRIFDSVGNYVPENAEFKIDEKDTDVGKRYIVVDQKGRQFGQSLVNQSQAVALSDSLNNIVKERSTVLESIKPIQESLQERLKGFGLNDIGLSIDRRVFNREGEALTSEGLFDPVVRRVFLAVDAIDPDGTLTTDQRREALSGVLRHEVVHALRYLDLWKKTEWNNLEKAASTVIKPGTGKTYLQIAQDNYSDATDVIKVEESVADLIRDVADRQSNIAGRPRTLSERAINFFDKAKNAVTGSGFQTYEDIVQRFEQGDIGARERGRIRTYRATEERLSKIGKTPERVQRLFTTPQDRNQFRQETVEKVQQETPAVAVPAINSLRLNAVRESRSTIDPVPSVIAVDDKEVSTRDSEGRLIYSGYEGPEVFNTPTRPTMDGLRNFWNWFGSSKTVDNSKRPLVYYHGTAADITEFKPKQAGSVFLTRSPRFAEEFSALSQDYMVSNFPDFMSDEQVIDILNETLQRSSAFTPSLYDMMAEARDKAVAQVSAGKAIRPGLLKIFKDSAAGGRSSRYLDAIQKRLPSGANLMPVYVKAENSFDYDNKEHINRVLKKVREISPIDLDSGQIEQFKKGDWGTIEGKDGNSPILDAIRELGYDSMFVEEGDQKNLAVFDPGQIKSAIGNNGDFSPLTPSIRESRKEPTYNIVNSRTGEVVGQANTIGGARRAVDRRDNQYGAYVHTIQTVDPERDIAARNVARERLGISPIERESRGVNIEVAPDPRDQAAVNTFNAFPENIRAEITTEVAEPVIRDTMRNLGIADYEVEYTLGGFQGGTQPSIIIRFGNAVPYNKMLEASKVLGTLWKQQAVIVYDENDKQGGVQTQFVKVIPSRKLSYDETKDLFKQIYDRYPEAAGFTGREGSLVFGNFLGKISPKDFHQGLDTALEDIDNDYIVTTTSDAFRSDWIEPVNLQGTQYESDTQKPVERGEILRRQREFDSLQGRSDELFRAAVKKRTGAEAASAEAALVPAVRESRRSPNVVGLISGEEVPPRKLKGKTQVAKYLQDRALEALGGRPRDLNNETDRDAIADDLVEEAIYEMEAQKNALEWYDTTIERTIELLSLKYPEIKTDPNARTAFLTGLAITSQNIAVPDNLKYAEEVYNYFQRNRRFPEKGFGSKSPSIKRNFEKANMLIDSLGAMEAFTDFLQDEFTVGRLNPILKEHLGKGAKVGGELVGANVYGSAVFGPKIGNGFYTNLRGDFSPVTIDMWFMRTIGRLRGKVMEFEEAKFGKQLDRLAKSENIEGASTDELVARAQQLAKQHEKDYKLFKDEYKAKVRNKSESTNAAITIVKSLKATRDAPSTGREREQLRDIVNRAINKMRDRTGQDIPPAAFQALIWYPEQDLYKKLGVKLKHVRQDYANSTKQFLRNEGFSERELKQSEDRVRGRRQRRAERVRPGAVAPVEAAVAPTSGRIGEAVPGAEAVPLIRESRRPQAQLDQAIVPAAREARRRGTPIGPTQPGPTNDTDSTSAAEALNGGQPVDSIGTPSGPTISDTEPDGTVDISGARIAPLTRRLVVQMIQSAPDKLRSGLGLDDLAKRIENYYDTYASRLGAANGIIRDAFKRIDLGGKTAALTTFEEFIRARENGRTEDAQSILDMATDSERQLIDAWNKAAIQTGEINTSIRTPNNKPMRVWDAKVGDYRAIRSTPNFFPRTFRREVMEVMQNPDLDPVLWQSLLDSLVEAGLAETTKGAEKYLLREWFSNEVAQDYFAGVEKARTAALPEIFYDYSWDAATRYLRKWARRTSQVENFGQTLEAGKFTQKEWFDANIPKVRNQETQNYLNSIKERIYEIEQFNALTNMASWGNSLATATQLGNPASASLNLIGGTITNVQQFGIKEIGKSYANLILDWKNVQSEGTTLGILNTDFMNILNDHVEMDVDKYFSGGRNKLLGITIPSSGEVSQALGKFTNIMLTFSGFNGAENIVRASAMLASISRLNSFLKDVNSGLETDAVKRFREYIKRENLDIDALILEDGAGKETERYLRRAVNVSQGSYKIDMAPVFIDTAGGRFFLKYQKFGTQVNRFFYNHFLKTFYDNPTPRNFMRIAGFVGTGIIGGGAIIAIRESIGYGDPGPDDEEIKKAFENKDTARGWGLIFSRAWQNIMSAGSLGFFGNYAQFAKDYQDQQRVKNPFSPPGLASVDAVIDVFNRLRDQGKLTARDLDEIAETTLSFYRANKRIGLAAMDAIGSDAREVRRFAAQKEIREVREYGRRYSEAMDIEFKRRSAPGAFAGTPMTPVNKAIADALQQGDAARARLLAREAIRGVRGEERDRVEASIRSSARNRQPIQIGGSAPSQDERMRFLRWARKNLPAEKYQMILRSDRNYRRTANRANIRIGD